MSALTLHAMDDSLAFALRTHAAELGVSINQAAKSLLASALGLTAKRKKASPGFLKYAGGLSHDEASELRAFVDGAAFSRIDKSDWE